MANPKGCAENLVPLNERTKDEQKIITTMGGVASGESRRKTASIKKSLTKILNSGFKLPTEIKDGDIKLFVEKLNYIGINTKDMELTDLMNCGQILSAIGGNSNAYKTLLEANGEQEGQDDITTPIVEINVIDNSNLEKIMYEENRHNKNDEGK